MTSGALLDATDAQGATSTWDFNAIGEYQLTDPADIAVSGSAARLKVRITSPRCPLVASPRPQHVGSNRRCHGILGARSAGADATQEAKIPRGRIHIGLDYPRPDYFTKERAPPDCVRREKVQGVQRQQLWHT